MRESWGSTYCKKKNVKSCLRWFGNVQKRSVEAPLRRVDQMEGSLIARGARPRKIISDAYMYFMLFL